jgi:hypothetical protein
MTDYQKGIVDGVAGVFAAIIEECDEEILSAVFKKLNIQKVEDE